MKHTDNVFYISLFEVDQIFFQNEEGRNTLKSVKFQQSSAEDVRKFLMLTGYEKIAVSITSDCEELGMTRAFRYFHYYLQGFQVEFSFYKLDRNCREYEKLKELSKSYRTNSCYAFLSGNYGEMNWRQLKHVEVDTPSPIQTLPISYQLPMNSLLIYKKEICPETSLFCVMQKESEYVKHGDVTVQIKEEDALDVSSEVLQKILHGMRLKQWIQIDAGAYTYIPFIRQKLQLPTLNLIRICEAGLCIRGQEKWEIVCSQMEDKKQLEQYASRFMRGVNQKYWRLVDTVIFYASRLKIKQAFRVENVLLTSFQNNSRYLELWNVLLLHTKEYLYLIKIDSRKIYKLEDNAVPLELVLETYDFQKDFLTYLLEYYSQNTGGTL